MYLFHKSAILSVAMLMVSNSIACDIFKSSFEGLTYTYEDCPTEPVPPAIVAGKLNDTGITWGATMENNNTTCTGVNIAGQDCSYGRDAKALAGTLTKIGGGRGGFDFTKLDANGKDLLATANAWSCVRDNVTGLIWEVKTDDDGLHDKDNTYTWYNTDSTNNGGDAGWQNGGRCVGSDCYTTGFVITVNNNGLCGAKDWRMPTVEELRNIIDKSTTNPAIDTGYFPNAQTQNSIYWSSSPNASNKSYAWVVRFYYGSYDDDYGKAKNNHVRLVRGGE